MGLFFCSTNQCFPPYQYHLSGEIRHIRTAEFVCLNHYCSSCTRYLARVARQIYRQNTAGPRARHEGAYLDHMTMAADSFTIAVADQQHAGQQQPQQQHHQEIRHQQLPTRAIPNSLLLFFWKSHAALA